MVAGYLNPIFKSTEGIERNTVSIIQNGVRRGASDGSFKLSYRLLGYRNQDRICRTQCAQR